MVSFFAIGLVLAGDLILIGSLIPVWHLVRKLPQGTVRSRWYLMTALITLFIPSYLGYASLFWQSHTTLVDLIVPFVFFFGACFVLLTTTLSLQTAMDIMRISLLERDVVTDPLTGVYNRRHLDRRLTEEVAIAKRYKQPVAVILLDIDHFKKVNDRYGHQAGDQVLVDMVSRVSTELRDVDVFARYGGEEFVIIAPHTNLSSAASLAERVRKRVEADSFKLPNGLGEFTELDVRVSIGVTSSAGGTEDEETLIQAADKNLFQAKQEGRNRVIANTP